MIINHNELKQIIKEELIHVLTEQQKIEENMLKRAAQAIGLGALVMLGFINSDESPMSEKPAIQQLQDAGVSPQEIENLPINSEGDAERIADAAVQLYKKYSRGMEVASNLESKAGIAHFNQKPSTVAMFGADAENLTDQDKSAYLLWHEIGISDQSIDKISSGDDIDPKTAQSLLKQQREMGLKHSPDHEFHQKLKNEFSKEIGTR